MILDGSSARTTEIQMHAMSLYIATWPKSHPVEHRAHRRKRAVHKEGDAVFMPSSGELQVHTQ